jgi:outer membrane protein assembly factor BamB
VLLAATFFLTTLAADWPQFLGPNRNGASTTTGLIDSFPAAGPPLVWERKVGAGFSGPVVAGGRLGLFHRVGNEEVVESLEAATGKEQWRFAYPTRYVDDFGFDEGPRATPAIDAGRIFTLGAEGTLHALDLTSGRKLWSRDLARDYEPRKGFFGTATSPLVERNLLLINVGGPAAGIVALEKDTGKEVWKATSHEASYSSPVAATIQQQRHVFFFTREGLVDLEPASGRARFSLRWRARIQASVNAASPVVAGDLLFLSASYDTGAIVLRITGTGYEEVWKSDESLSCHYNTPVQVNGFLYGLHGRQEYGASLRCIELVTGKVCWTQERFGCASLVHADGRLIALTETGDLVLFEPTPEAYREKARARILGKPTRAAPALADGRLFARDEKKLVCLHLGK